MKLITKDLLNKLPAFYSQEKEKDPILMCKYYMPLNRWVWYPIEFDGVDTFFGYVVGDNPELGYFSLSELESVEGSYGLRVERDRYFEPTRLSSIKEKYESSEILDTINLRKSA